MWINMTLPLTNKPTAEFQDRKLGLSMLTSNPKGTRQPWFLHYIFRDRKIFLWSISEIKWALFLFIKHWNISMTPSFKYCHKVVYIYTSEMNNYFKNQWIFIKIHKGLTSAWPIFFSDFVSMNIWVSLNFTLKILTERAFLSHRCKHSYNIKHGILYQSEERCEIID